MNELPPHVKAVLDAARSAHDPSEHDRARVQQGLWQAIGATSAAAALGAPTLQAAASAGQSAAQASASSVKGANIAAVAAKVFLASVLLGGASFYLATRDPRTGEMKHPHAVTSAAESVPAQTAPIERAKSFARVPEGAVSESLGAAHPASEPTTSAPGNSPTRVPKMTKPRTISHGESRTGASRTRPATLEWDEVEAAEGERAAPKSTLPSVAQVAEDSPPVKATNSAAQAASTDELSLMRSVLTSLRDHHPLTALDLLEQHAQRFPSGVLVVERKGLRVVALCNGGMFDAGRREQALFLQQHGRTPVAERVRAACAQEDRER